MGTYSNIEHVNKIENALRIVMNKFPQVRLRIVSDQRPQFKNISSAKLEYIKWSPENEVACLQGLSVGIMPLEESLWTRGKCSYKMLQYLACGVPVVVSPIGMNSEVLGRGQCGLAANDEHGWIDGLTTLLENAKLRRQMGTTGRQVVLDHYSVEALVPELSACIKRTARVSS
jgi:glycosyltransferase involved in cell wall biosynthesis